MTKYLRQIKRARTIITAKGTTVSWFKPGAADNTDPTPEFPELADAAEFDNIPIVFYPVNRQSEGSIVYDPKLFTGVENLYGIIPGDVTFTPEENDPVIIAGDLYHVNYVNTTQPDMTPIVHEIGFK